MYYIHVTDTKRQSSSTKMSNVIDANEMLTNSAYYRKTCILYILYNYNLLYMLVSMLN